jgi:hypothetical protein
MPQYTDFATTFRRVEHRSPGAGQKAPHGTASYFPCRTHPVAPRRKFLQAPIRFIGRNPPDTPRLVLVCRPTHGQSLLHSQTRFVRPSRQSAFLRLRKQSGGLSTYFSHYSQEVLIPAHRVIVSRNSSARTSIRKQGGHLIRGHRRTERLALALRGYRFGELAKTLTFVSQYQYQ